LILGYGILAVSLMFDGLMALKEKIISHEVHHKKEFEEYQSRLSWEYMRLFSFFTLVCCGVGLVVSYFTDDKFIPAINSYLQSKDLLNDFIVYCFLTSIGQIFLFQILEKWGPLTLSIITSIRKVLSIGLSIVLFGKQCSALKIVALLLGCTIIFWEVYEKKKQDDKKNKTKENEKME
jgi:drug/metabolite transporter (DMT)-like permease